MPVKSKKRKAVRKPRPMSTGGCFYCLKKLSPDYLNPQDIGRYVSDRARIVGSDISGLCAKHQRRVSLNVKRARHLGLLPFKARV